MSTITTPQAVYHAVKAAHDAVHHVLKAHPKLMDVVDSFTVIKVPGGGFGVQLAFHDGYRLGYRKGCCPDTTMVEPKRGAPHVTSEELERILLHEVRPCYCDFCMSDLFETSRSLPLREIRRDVALVNGIPLTGSKRNEAKIDALLTLPKENP